MIKFTAAVDQSDIEAPRRTTLRCSAPWSPTAPQSPAKPTTHLTSASGPGRGN